MTTPSAPGPLEPTETLHFESTGATLYGEWFAHPSPRATAVVVHGYFEHCGRYREVANVLHRAGFAVLTFDVRGHGHSSGQRGYIDAYAQFLDDVDAAIAKARALGGDRKLVLVAHSNGGLIVLRHLVDAARRSGAVAAAISSPYLALKLPVPTIKVVAGKIASRIYPRFHQSTGINPEDITSDPDKQAERLADTLCHDSATARFFTESNAAQALVAEKASSIAIPTLWMVAGADPVANPATSLAIAARVPGATVHELSGFRHEVWNERERGRVFDLMTRWLGERVA